MKRMILLGGLVFVFAASLRWTGQAQQPAAGQALFTGKSELIDSKDLSVARRSFEPGARSYWHSHEKGQLLLVERGRMRVQHRGQAMREIGAGETDYTGPAVEHWHGAIPNQELIQIYVNFTGPTKWLEAVGDEEYAGRKKR